MRFVSAIFVCIVALGSSIAFADGYSKVYTQCLNNAYGDLEIIKKCVSTEQEKQNKLLKQYYEKILENNGQHTANIKQQRQLWQNLVEQRCYSALKSDFGKIRQAKCHLEMTMNQVGYYKSKQLGLS
ncbi:hypothetical protein B9T25_13640 [Acinetobacter sp. ANC 4470]|uniref:lysozyme inhibitor LprI family protein n=1 Tax=Acinetobacter sp. ANC 4470 TaxID=1977881 RepID=UPI000A34CCC8|nr:lysozyme inhibitor LprI family protein [Acinetobacter sp. ANC 4470]OTG63533.1 hypothetical protein B9T25_13640 [Acinetobacter sp. ANC 4470]